MVQSLIKELFRLVTRAGEVYRAKGIKTVLGYWLKYIHRQFIKDSDIYYKLNRTHLCRRCARETDTDPLKIIWVNPDTIEYLTGTINSGPTASHIDHVDGFRGDLTPFGSIQPGNWDQLRDEDRFSDLALYKGIKSKYLEDLEWEETDFYKQHIKRIKLHRKSFSCKSEEELLDDLRQTDELYESIRKEGYKCQRKLGRYPTGEITVNIGRNGDLLFNGGGRHRLAIAKVLNLDSVPVVILVRHTKWQALREEIYATESREELSSKAKSKLDHPDLQDIVDEQLR